MEEEDFKNLSVEDRCVHKAWKARVSGYEDVTKLFHQIDDEKSPEFAKYLGLIKKFATDSNAMGQEKGLEATLAYIENYANAGKTVGEVMSGIVAKGVAANRTRTRDLSQQIALMYVEIERTEAVYEELMKGMDLKNPKIVTACVTVAAHGLRAFGSRVVAVKPLVKKVATLFADRDKGVRDEARLLAVEIYKWIGPVVKSQLTSLQPVQLAELELEFAKVGGQKARPYRYLRSQQEKQSKMVTEVPNDTVDNDEDDEGDAAGRNEALDPYDLTDPVDVLANLPKDFYNKLEEKNWKERKVALEVLENLAKTPKLENGDYGELVRALNKIIQKDSNVVCVALAAKCIAALADGLKKRFHAFASVCVSSLLDKFKEKKVNVVVAVREAIDAVYSTTTIENVLEDALEALGNKNPSVKAETLLFLARAFCKTPPTAMNKKLLKAYTGCLIKIINEPDPLVRDSAAEALGTLLKLVGDKAIHSFIAELEKDQLKMAKVKEYCDKAVITKMGVRSAGAKSKALTVGEVAPSVTKPSAAVTPAHGKASTKVVRTKRRPAPAGSSEGTTNSGSRMSKGVGGGGARKHATTSVPTVGGGVAKVTERELGEDEAVEIMTEVLPMITDLAVTIPSALTDTNWKTRLAAIEPLLSWLQNHQTDDSQLLPTQACVRLVCKKPGLKDTNFQVLKGRLDVIKYLAQHCRFSNTTAECCLNDIVEKLSDAKNGATAAETLTVIAEATHLSDVSAQAMEFAFTQKNPIVLQETLGWLATAVKEFGIGNLNAKLLIDNAKKALSSNNTSVRQAGVTLLGSLYLFMGPNLHVFLENEKQALRDRINVEFEKYENEKPPTPIRGVQVTDSGEFDNEEEANSTPSAPIVNPLDLLPKVDVSAQITDTLLTELADKNWQVRLEALNKVLAIVAEARMIKPSLGELPDALALRLVDSNTKIAQTALTVCEVLARSMSSAGRQHIRTLFPGFLQGLGDSKAWIRTSSISCINTFAEQCGYKDFFESEMIHDALKSGSPTLRIELWSWLAETLPKIKSVPKEELLLCVPYLYTNLEDRNADVRKNAGEVVLGMMIHLGYQTMAKQIEKLKPSSKPAVQAALEKARPNLPEKPAANKKSADDKRTVPAAGRPSTGAAVPKAVAKKTGAIPKQPVASRKKDEDVDTSPLLVTNNLKSQRTIDEAKLKVLKWNFTTPREEFVDLLREQMTTAGVNRTLTQNMFHSDFKYHIKAIESLSDDLPDNSHALVANLDLVLKWLTLRFFDTNPSVLLKGLEYLNSVFTMLGESNYHMLDNEAASFIPYLVVKVGDPKDSVRSGVRILFTHISNVYAISKLFSYLMEGLKSKNARQRAECLEVMGSMIGDYGMSVCLPSESVCMKEVAKQISDRDNSVRNAALNCVVQAFYIVGERIYKLVGKISDKDLSLLEERIKRASKQRPSMPSNAQMTTTKPTTGKFTLPPQVSPTSPGNYDPGHSSHGDHQLSRDGEDYDGDGGELGEGEGEAEMMTDVNLPPQVVVEPEEFIGPFHLDEELLRKLDSMRYEIHMPKLLKLDLDFLKEDVVMPTLEDTRRQMQNIQHTSKPPTASPIITLLSAVKHIGSGQELMVQNIINNLASPDILLAAQAFDQMLSILQSPKSMLLLNLEDQFMAAIGKQLKLLFSLDPKTNLAAMKLYKALLTVVDSFYANKALGKNVTMAVLKDILMQFIKLLFEAKFSGCPNGDMFIRVINIHSVKIIEKSDHTAIVCCLVQLLGDCLRTNQHERIVDLAMKCLWRVIRLIPKWADDLTFDDILLQIHRFLCEFPSSWWKSREVDTPLRTIKTVLHCMTKIKGAALMLHLSLISNRSESEMEAFILKLLKSLKLDEVKTVPLKSEATSAMAPTSPPQPQHALNKSTQSQLTEDGKNWTEKDFEHLKGPEYYQQFLDNFLKEWDEKIKRFYEGDIDNST